MTSKKVLTRKETAELIGVNVRTLDNWQKKGRIAHIKIGRSVFYTADAINKLFNLPNTSSDE